MLQSAYVLKCSSSGAFYHPSYLGLRHSRAVYNNGVKPQSSNETVGWLGGIMGHEFGTKYAWLKRTRECNDGALTASQMQVTAL